jgi:hypothetical protein
MASQFDPADKMGGETGPCSYCLDNRRSVAGVPDLGAVANLRTELDAIPAVSIEEAAELLEVSVLTLYRRRAEFEHRRRKGHLYFTLRSVKQHIELEQYNPTFSFDATTSDVLDGSDSRFAGSRLRRTQPGGYEAPKRSTSDKRR